MLHGPGCLAKLGQAHHARTALQGVEGPTQGGLHGQVTRLGRQCPDGIVPRVHHLAGFFQEDVQQVVLVGRRIFGGRRDRFWRGGGSDRLQRVQCTGQAGFVLSACRIGGALRRIRQGRLVGQGGHGRNLIELPRDGLGRQTLIQQRGWRRHRHHNARLAIQQQINAAGLGRRLVDHWPRRGRATRHMPEFSEGGVVDEQLACQHRLVAQHVDLKPERTQAVAELLEGARAVGLHRIGLGGHELIDHVAQATDGQRGLVQTQHGQHTTHLPHQRRHRGQHGPLGRVAEELVQMLLHLAQRGAQLAHHGAHGLAIADVAVQFLHPGLQGRRQRPCPHRVQALGQLSQACGERHVTGLKIGERRLQEQHRGGGFHGQFGPRWTPRLRDLLGDTVQRRAQHMPLMVQFVQRFGHQAELVDAGLGARHVPAGQGGPVLLDRFDATARLCQNRRIVEAEGGLFVRRRILGLQGPGLAHRIQSRGSRPRVGACLGTEKQQVVGQPLGHRLAALCQRRVLDKDARGSPLDAHIHLD